MTRSCLTFASIILLSTTLGAQSLAVVRNNNEFAIAFYKECSIKAGSQNVFISPFSISSALAMTYPGARGQTAEEMEKALFFLDNLERQNQEYKVVMTDLKKDGSPFIVSNTLWTQTGFAFDPEFINTNSTYFNASVNQINFLESKKATDTINSTIERQTKAKIKDLIPPGAINRYTRLVLTNAVYFKDAWAKVFKEEDTQGGDFHSAAGQSVNAMFMMQKGYFKSYESDVVSAIELTFKHENYSMVILLPKVSMADFESDFFASDTYPTWKLNPEKFDKILIPRFKIEMETNPEPILNKFGMKKAFIENVADFSGITTQSDLFISGIFHKAFIEVNEEGAEAAAATAVVIEARSMQPKREFIADRPFIFLIKENTTQSILFIGKLNDPGDEGKR